MAALEHGSFFISGVFHGC
uniref:Uncharacterized protein n=1 Tax=Arundo donax TaxID=35708 RepID=A0A0A9GLH3_ARUDO